MCCDLEVDVNGEKIFLVDKRVLVSFSDRFRKMFGKFRSTRKNLKVIFHDFPGGAECFELITRFCYRNGRIDITPSNVFLLHCGAKFMEMSGDEVGVLNLVKQTELYVESIHCWTWSELISGLKQCQDLFPALNSSPIFHDFLIFLVQSLTLPSGSSPCRSPSASSSYEFSGEMSANSSKTSNSQTAWWFKDLVFLNLELFEVLVKTMVLQSVDHPTISSFLFHYQKSRFFHCPSPAEKSKTLETIINLLCLLDGNFISSKGLLDAFGMGLSLKMRRRDSVKLESLIGSRLDEATIDHLLVPSPDKKKYAYDVDLILRLMKAFLLQRRYGIFRDRLKKVAALMDLFMAEVAPDPWLEPSKFTALAMAMPDIARDSHDRMYRATDMYIEIQVFSVLNLNKLSLVALKSLVKNTKFPRELRGNALTYLQPKSKSFIPNKHLKICERLPEEADNAFHYASNLNFPAAYEKLNAHFPDSQCKSRLSTSNVKSLSGFLLL